MDDRYFTLTSAVGKFIFPRSTIMSHAKLVRDTIVGTVLGPEKSPTPNNVNHWLKNNLQGPVKDTQFEWVR